MPDAPGAMGSAGQGAGGGGDKRDYKRADYLESEEAIGEAVGEAPYVSRPVVRFSGLAE